MTDEEKHLWYDFLNLLPVTVKRQKVIGKYIADFYVPQQRVVTELDGAQHYEEQAREYDRKRDEYMESIDITVLRYTNRDINTNFKGVCQDIANHLGIELDLL
ncbi:MAG: DUF559 domain-containing protein [Clostridia bacterium]|nr:DUF559 domain-containing protein [Clostridia bacterium]